MNTKKLKKKTIKHSLLINKEIVNKKWYIIDASEKILGRIASKVSHLLQGKHKILYSKNKDNGDYVIIINSSKIRVTGKKNKNKFYFHHTGYVGNLKKISFNELIKKNPNKIIKLAIKGMLPKGPLGRKMLKKIKIYPGPEHKHIAQNPKIIKI